MINVCVNSTGSTFEFKIEGHARSAPKGEDLICAAATILVRTAAAILQESSKDITEIDISDGKARIKLTEYDPVAVVEMSVIVKGFVLLMQEYPEYIKIFTETEKNAQGGAESKA